MATETHYPVYRKIAAKTSITSSDLTSDQWHSYFLTAPPPYSPTLWLHSLNIDGSDNGSLANSDPITTWTDQSGNGYNFTQSTVADKPLFKTNISNSKPGVLFDGSTDFMASTATTGNIMTASTCTIFVVANTVAFSSGGAPPNGAGIIVDIGSYWQISTKTTSTYNASIYDGTYDEVTSSAKTAGVTYVLTMQKTGGNISLAVNTDTPASTASGTIPDTSNILNLGRSGAGGSVKWNGYLFEIITYNTALTTNQKDGIVTNLMNKYGL